jgi:hypothetical protein
VTVSIFKEAVAADGSKDRYEPYRYECGNYMRGDSTRSSDVMIGEQTLESLGSWIVQRQKAGLPGGVRMRSTVTGKKGLHSIRKIEVRNA